MDQKTDVTNSIIAENKKEIPDFSNEKISKLNTLMYPQ